MSLLGPEMFTSDLGMGIRVLEDIEDHLDKLWNMSPADWEARFRTQCLGLEDRSYQNVASAAVLIIRSLKPGPDVEWQIARHKERLERAQK